MKRLSLFLGMVALSALTAGCGSPDQTGQEVANLAWKSDGSGIVALIQQYDASIAASTGVANFALFSNSGSFIQTIPESDLSYPINTTGYPQSFFLAPNNSSAVVQLGAPPSYNLYSVGIPSGGENIITTKVNLLCCSPDLQYAVVSPSPTGTNPTFTISVLNISGKPYVVKNFDVTNFYTSAGAFWLDNGKFALTFDNGSAWQVNIYDTTGSLADSVVNAAMRFGQGKFVQQTDELFVLSNPSTISGIDRYNLATHARTAVFPSGGESVVDFDVSSDGTLMALLTSTGLYALNVKDQDRSLISSDVTNIVFGAFLSPDAKHVAYVSQDPNNTSFQNILVASISLPN